MNLTKNNSVHISCMNKLVLLVFRKTRCEKIFQLTLNSSFDYRSKINSVLRCQNHPLMGSRSSKKLGTKFHLLIGGGAHRLVRLEPYLNQTLLGYALPDFRLRNQFSVEFNSVRSSEIYFNADSRTFFHDSLYIVIKK